jgi:hypothetical protein
MKKYLANVIVNGRLEYYQEMPHNLQLSYEDLQEHLSGISTNKGIQLIYNSIIFKYLRENRYISFIKGCHLSKYETNPDCNQQKIFDSDAHDKFSAYVNASANFRGRELDTKAVLKLLGSKPIQEFPFRTILRISREGLQIISGKSNDSKPAQDTIYISRCSHFNVRHRKKNTVSYESKMFDLFLTSLVKEFKTEFPLYELEQVGVVEIIISDPEDKGFVYQVGSAIEKHI